VTLKIQGEFNVKRICLKSGKIYFSKLKDILVCDMLSSKGYLETGSSDTTNDNLKDPILKSEVCITCSSKL
jgi:hypothetical protein